MFLEFKESPTMEKLAKKLVKKYGILNYINTEEILFLQETVSRPKALARCFKFGDHPIMFFTDKLYAIVFYESVCGYLSKEQRVLLMYHELRHIGIPFKNMNDHNVKDFKELLRVDLDWANSGKEVPDILKGDDTWEPK